jgi:hypothetical protein
MPNINGVLARVFVPDLDGAGGQIIEGPSPAPNGDRLIARHPDGSIFEYIETGSA